MANSAPAAAAPRTPYLFQPFSSRSVTARNRIAVSPMCQYSAKEGMPNDWHLVHLGSRAVGGAGIVFTEAAAVEPRGRITPQCVGLWNDAQGEAFARIAAFMAEQGAVPAMQLAHAGRKGSAMRPWDGRDPLTPDNGGWEVLGPSPIPFAPGHPVPVEMNAEDIARVAGAFGEAAGRAHAAGFKVLEVHAAHGYLIHEFLSPLSNQRSDAYGGSLENRARILMEVLDAVRGQWPDTLPLFVRISGTDWVEGGWDLEQAIELSKMLAARGDVDLMDCSGGGSSPDQQMVPTPGYQVPFADAIRREAGIATGAVGMIRSPHMAEEILANGRADLIVMGRIFLSQPQWPLHAAKELGADIEWPNQYKRGNM